MAVTCDNGTSLAPGTSTNCTFTRTVSGSPSDKVTDKVCVNGTSTVGAVPQACGCTAVSITDVKPTATVDKSVMQAAVCATVRYQVTVANTDKWGRQLTLTGLADSKFDDLTKDQNSANPKIVRTDCTLPQTPLSVGGAPFTCTFDAVVCGDSLPHTNIITATLAEVNSTNVITQSGSATVTGVSISTK